jgi:RES domain-containing protein
VRIYRLVKKRYAVMAFSGAGALRYPGRWHLAGTPVVYATDQPSSALLEVLVHTEASELVTHPLVLFSIDLDPERHLIGLPPGHRIDGMSGQRWSHATQRFGTNWAERQSSVVLGVPSAVVPLQTNFLINPLHPHFGELIVSGPDPFPIDPRLAR